METEIKSAVFDFTIYVINAFTHFWTNAKNVCKTTIPYRKFCNASSAKLNTAVYSCSLLYSIHFHKMRRLHLILFLFVSI